MDRHRQTRNAERRELANTLVAPSADVHVRPATNFGLMDESIFYAKDDFREFTVCVVDDVNWGKNLSYYVNEPDEFHRFRRMYVDVPNSFYPYVTEIKKLFVDWFGTERAGGL